MSRMAPDAGRTHSPLLQSQLGPRGLGAGGGRHRASETSPTSHSSPPPSFLSLSCFLAPLLVPFLSLSLSLSICVSAFVRPFCLSHCFSVSFCVSFSLHLCLLLFLTTSLRL